MDIPEIIEKIEALSNPDAVEGMARFGIKAAKVYGLSLPQLRALAKEIGHDQSLSLRLWAVNSRETRILAAMVGESAKATDGQADDWANDFDSWEICDATIMYLFEKAPFAWEKAFQWSESDKEFVKRAGFSMMARLAVSDKKTSDIRYEQFFSVIIRESVDPRNSVKKAVNWALRQIGKRSFALNAKALDVAEKLRLSDSKPAKWIASDAIRELRSEKIRARIKR